jgi:hypothetical protein
VGFERLTNNAFTARDAKDAKERQEQQRRTKAKNFDWWTIHQTRMKVAAEDHAQSLRF